MRETHIILEGRAFRNCGWDDLQLIMLKTILAELPLRNLEIASFDKPAHFILGNEDCDFLIIRPHDAASKDLSQFTSPKEKQYNNKVKYLDLDHMDRDALDTDKHGLKILDPTTMRNTDSSTSVVEQKITKALKELRVASEMSPLQRIFLLIKGKLSGAKNWLVRSLRKAFNCMKGNAKEGQSELLQESGNINDLPDIRKEEQPCGVANKKSDTCMSAPQTPNSSIIDALESIDAHRTVPEEHANKR